jgi:sec-independent protein translocase protein TatB
MFDIGFPELILIAVVGLVILGPERLPAALRAIGLWLGRAQRSYDSVKAQIEKEVGMEEVHRQLRREVMEEKIKLHQAAQPVSGDTLEPEIAAREQRAAEARARAEASEVSANSADVTEEATPVEARQA